MQPDGRLIRQRDPGDSAVDVLTFQLGEQPPIQQRAEPPTKVGRRQADAELDGLEKGRVVAVGNAARPPAHLVIDSNDEAIPSRRAERLEPGTALVEGLGRLVDLLRCLVLVACLLGSADQRRTTAETGTQHVGSRSIASTLPSSFFRGRRTGMPGLEILEAR